MDVVLMASLGLTSSSYTRSMSAKRQAVFEARGSVVLTFTRCLEALKVPRLAELLAALAQMGACFDYNAASNECSEPLSRDDDCQLPEPFH